MTLGAPTQDSVHALVDTVRYPLGDPTSQTYRRLLERVRRDLTTRGCAVLPGLVPAPHLGQLSTESETLAPWAHTTVEQVNVYNTAPDAGLPADHPARVTFRRGNCFVARDHIDDSTVIARLYASEALRHFVAAAFGLPEVHRLADPLSGLCLNVVEPGQSHPWHFDVNDLTVSLLTRAPEAGGTFEFCPAIRTPTDENLAAVRGVITGDDTRPVRRLTLRPGDLQLFAGRYALHRVCPVRGSRARHCAIFAYSAQPGVVGSPERTRQLFGRLTPAHERAAATSIDGLLT